MIVYEYDSSKSALHTWVGKINLSKSLSKRFTKQQKEVEDYYHNSKEKDWQSS